MNYEIKIIELNEFWFCQVRQNNVTIYFGKSQLTKKEAEEEAKEWIEKNNPNNQMFNIQW